MAFSLLVIIVLLTLVWMKKRRSNDRNNSGSTQDVIAHENQVRVEEWSAGEWSAGEWSAGTNSGRHEYAYAYPEFGTTSTETNNTRENLQRMAEDSNLKPRQTGLIQRSDDNSGRQEQTYAYPELENISAETNYRQENVLPYIDFVSAQTTTENPYLEPVENKRVLK